MSYFPKPFVGDMTVQGLHQYFSDELQAISRDLRETRELELRPRHAAPDKPREGMIVFADGTDWNPGSGKNVYVYKGGAWVAL